MRRYLCFFFVVGLSLLMTGVLFAEPLRIGVSSGADMGAQKFNPSFNFQSTPNAPARSVDFVVYTADQGTQAAGDTCATNPQSGVRTSGLQMDSWGDWQTGIEQFPPNMATYEPGRVWAPNPNGTGPVWRPPTPNNPNTPWGWDPQTDPLDPDPENPDPPAVAPEPSTMLVLGIGLAVGVLPLARRFRRQK